MCFVVTEDLNEVVNRLESTFHEVHQCSYLSEQDLYARGTSGIYCI